MIEGERERGGREKGWRKKGGREKGWRKKGGREREDDIIVVTSSHTPDE